MVTVQKGREAYAMHVEQGTSNYPNNDLSHTYTSYAGENQDKSIKSRLYYKLGNIGFYIRYGASEEFERDFIYKHAMQFELGEDDYLNVDFIDSMINSRLLSEKDYMSLRDGDITKIEATKYHMKTYRSNSLNNETYYDIACNIINWLVNNNDIAAIELKSKEYDERLRLLLTQVYSLMPNSLCWNIGFASYVNINSVNPIVAIERHGIRIISMPENSARFYNEKIKYIDKNNDLPNYMRAWCSLPANERKEVFKNVQIYSLPEFNSYLKFYFDEASLSFFDNKPVKGPKYDLANLILNIYKRFFLNNTLAVPSYIVKNVIRKMPEFLGESIPNAIIKMLESKELSKKDKKTCLNIIKENLNSCYLEKAIESIEKENAMHEELITKTNELLDKVAASEKEIKERIAASEQGIDAKVSEAVLNLNALDKQINNIKEELFSVKQSQIEYEELHNRVIGIENKNYDINSKINGISKKVDDVRRAISQEIEMLPSKIGSAGGITRPNSPSKSETIRKILIGVIVIIIIAISSLGSILIYDQIQENKENTLQASITPTSAPTSSPMPSDTNEASDENYIEQARALYFEQAQKEIAEKKNDTVKECYEGTTTENKAEIISLIESTFTGEKESLEEFKDDYDVLLSLSADIGDIEESVVTDFIEANKKWFTFEATSENRFEIIDHYKNILEENYLANNLLHDNCKDIFAASDSEELTPEQFDKYYALVGVLSEIDAYTEDGDLTIRFNELKAVKDLIIICDGTWQCKDDETKELIFANDGVTYDNNTYVLYVKDKALYIKQTGGDNSGVYVIGYDAENEILTLGTEYATDELTKKTEDPQED